jgi:hypothetical protein
MGGGQDAFVSVARPGGSSQRPERVGLVRACLAQALARERRRSRTPAARARCRASLCPASAPWAIACSRSKARIGRHLWGRWEQPPLCKNIKPRRHGPPLKHLIHQGNSLGGRSVFSRSFPRRGLRLDPGQTAETLLPLGRRLRERLTLPAFGLVSCGPAPLDAVQRNLSGQEQSPNPLGTIPRRNPVTRPDGKPGVLWSNCP